MSAERARAIDERYSLHAEALATKRDAAALQAEAVRSIAETKVELMKWMHSVLTAQTALIPGVMKLV
ncbi:MAG: hypothetical protein LC121_07760 [Anaerolineae bacterium]|nr:hypothetical protein [Anaerolineae bacterium]